LAVLSDRPIAYHPALARVVGVKEALLLCQFLYWDGKGRDSDGWIWKTQEDITEETGLSRAEQEGARRRLGTILQTDLKGIPAKLHYRINFDVLAHVLEEAYPQELKPDAENQQASMPETSIQEGENQADSDAENQQTISESTQETTQESTHPEKEQSGAAAPSAAVVNPLSPGQKLVLDAFGAKRYRNRVQALAVLNLEERFGMDKLKPAAEWAAKQGMGLGQAIVSMEKAVPKWGAKGTSMVRGI